MAKIKASKKVKREAKSFKISLDELDKNWVEQQDWYEEYADLLPDAKEKVDDYDTKLDLAKADAELDIRNNPSEYFDGDLKEALVKALVAKHEKVEKYTKLLNTAKHRVRIIEAGINKLEMRKRCLEGLVSLHGQSYFARPRAKSHDRNALDKSKRDRIYDKTHRV